MKNLFEVPAKARTDEGKGASRRLRRAGVVPAVVYGAGEEPESISIDHNRFIRHLEEEAFYAHILTLDVDGKKTQVVLKDLQRHPSNDNKIVHADFLRIDAKNLMTMSIPLRFINAETAVGVKAGGVVFHLMTEVEVSCLPKDLPAFIEVDVSKLGLNEFIHLSELELPKDVTLVALAPMQDEKLEEGERSAYDQAVVSIQEPRVSAEDEAEDAAADADAEEDKDKAED